MRTLNSIVVLTGAGVSAESGLATFRAADGLWEKYKIEEVATPAGFASNPRRVHEFYNERRTKLLSGAVQPNQAHKALALFEEKWTGQFVLVTQNIDDLHERAGSKNLIHMHGELLKIRCSVSGKTYPIKASIDSQSECECCHRAGTLRPDVVWFGEMPMHLDEIYSALECCDAFISIGTSGNVYPAAGFVESAKQNYAHTVELNLEPSSGDSMFDEKFYGQATSVVPAYLDKMLSCHSM